MTRRRLPINGAAIVLAALLLTSCSGDQGASNGDPVAGKQLFAANGCSGCHTFKAAGSTGTTGPGPRRRRPEPGQGHAPARQPRRPHAELRRQAVRRARSATSRRSSARATAPARPSTAPFRPDSKRLADCRDGNFECLEQAFGNLTYNEGPEARARAPADDVDDGRRRRRRLPPHRASHGLGRALALQGQGRAGVHRRHAGLRLGLLPRHHRARVPRPADGQARRRRAPDVHRLADHAADVPALPVHPRPRPRAHDLHRLRPAASR